jgi:hypothetical protein
MIQRLQSLYLSMTLALSLLLFTGNILRFRDEGGKVFSLSLDGNLTDQAGGTFAHVPVIWPLLVILIVIALLSLITILFYKNRKVQLSLAISVIALSLLLMISLGLYALSIINNFSLAILPGFKIAIPLIILIFSILAYLGIRKDDRLVKSYERLR